MNGQWHQELIRQDSYAESSATALYMYGYGVGLRLGYLNPECFNEAYERGLLGMLRFINPDFSVEGCCPGCLCPGKGINKGTVEAYMQRFPVKDDPHVFGPMMLALTEAYRIGIVEIEK